MKRLNIIGWHIISFGALKSEDLGQDKMRWLPLATLAECHLAFGSAAVPPSSSSPAARTGLVCSLCRQPLTC